MNFFLSKLVFQIVNESKPHNPQFDEQWRLVQANTEKQALAKAEIIGQNEELSFMNTAAQKISWRYIGIADICKMPNMTDGTELFSRIEETMEYEQYICNVKQKNTDLQERFAV